MVLYGFWTASLKVHNLVSDHPKSIKLGQMTNLNMIFHMVVPVYLLVKIGNSPQFPVQFWNGLSEQSIPFLWSNCKITILKKTANVQGILFIW